MDHICLLLTHENFPASFLSLVYLPISQPSKSNPKIIGFGAQIIPRGPFGSFCCRIDLLAADLRFGVTEMEEKFKDAVHRLEKESGFFFNMKLFEEKVQGGEWDEVENRYSSMKIFFEIRKQKYLEALDRRQDKAKAVEILTGDLKVLSTFNEELYKEITQLLTLTNFRNEEEEEIKDLVSSTNS